MLFLAPLLLAQTPQPEATSLLPRAPAGWRRERLEFPLDFAPELELRGHEDLVFAPGMFAPDSDSYFSYVLALRLEGDVELDDAFLDHFLETYYRGLCRAVGGERKLELDLASIAAEVRHDGPVLRARVAMFDPFVTGEALDLELELMTHVTPRATELLGLASPLPLDAPVWKELHAIATAWTDARPAPLFLNHVYVVLDRETFDACAGSSFLRESLAVSEQRETVRGDMSYSGLYFYGARTYFEFLPPDAAGLGAGSTGLAFGLERAGASDTLARTLAAHAVPSQAFPITRQLEGTQVPWFQMLSIAPAQASSRLGLFSLEYDPRFLATWHPELAPAGAGIRRSEVLERYAGALGLGERRTLTPLADVSAVELALAPAESTRLLALCAAAGFELEHDAETWTCRGPQFRLLLRPSEIPGGITGLTLALRQPVEREPLTLGKAELRFQGNTATVTFRP